MITNNATPFTNMQPQGNSMAPAGMVNPRPQTPINPQGFSNMPNVNSVFGQAMPGTFNRQVGNTPFMQMTSQGYIPPMDPTNPSATPDINALTSAQTGQPLMPPTGVQQTVSPYYDLSNQ